MFARIRTRDHAAFASAAAMALVLTGASAFATPIVNSSTFLPGPINIAFDTPVVTPDTPVTTQYQSLGATFSGAVQGDVGNAGIPNQDGNTIQDFISNGPVFQPLVITFNTPVTSADFALAQQVGTALITSYLNGVQVEQFTAVDTVAVFQTDNISGFKNSLFNSISIEVSSSDHADIIDNLQFTTPEPASLGLLSFAGLGLLARRRSAK